MIPSLYRLFIIAALLPGLAFSETLPDTMAEGLFRQKRFREAEVEFERLAYEQRGKPGERMAIEKALAAASATEDPAFLLTVSRAWKGRETLGCLPDLYERLALYRLDNPNSVVK